MGIAMINEDKMKVVLDLMVCCGNQNTKQFCRNIINQGWCSEKQYHIVEKMKVQWLRSITLGKHYHEECYGDQENTNSWY